MMQSDIQFLAEQLKIIAENENKSSEFLLRMAEKIIDLDKRVRELELR